MKAFTLNDVTGEYDATRPLAETDIIDQAKFILTERFSRSGPMLGSPDDTRDFLTVQLTGLEHEVFAVAFLDVRHRGICFKRMFRGTIDSATVHPREVVKAALRLNAAAVILAHNNPSGNPDPSSADKAITRRLIDALQCVYVKVLDHIVVGGAELVSLAERGLI
jgi:DNA repair protein RadC